MQTNKSAEIYLSSMKFAGNAVRILQQRLATTAFRNHKAACSRTVNFNTICIQVSDQVRINLIEFRLEFFREGKRSRLYADVSEINCFKYDGREQVGRFVDANLLSNRLLELIEIRAFETAGKKLDGGNDHGGTQASTQTWR
jgi:hypothetical protein